MKKYQYIRKTLTFNGKRYTVYGNTEKEAIEKLAVLKISLEKGEIVTLPNTTVKNWITTYLETYQKPRINSTGIKTRGTITLGSYQTYETKLLAYVLPQIGHLKLKSVTPLQLQSILNMEVGTSYSHVHKLSLSIKGLFSQAKKNNLIITDPSEFLTLPAFVKNERRSLTDEEIKLFLKVCETHPKGIWGQLMYYTGIRPSESPVLQASDFDLQNKILHITKGLEKGSNIISKPKTKSGIRKIPIPDIFYPNIKEYILSSTTEYLFPQTNGSMATINSLSNWWNSIYRAMDILAGAKINSFGKIIDSVLKKDISLDSLRHTYCTNLQKQGVPINIAKTLMGHSSISITANIYTHASDDDIAIAAQLINNK